MCNNGSSDELAHAGHPIGTTEVLRMIHEIGMSNAWAHQDISTYQYRTPVHNDLPTVTIATSPYGLSLHIIAV